MKKLMAVVLPAFLVLSLMMAPIASAQQTHKLQSGESIEHNGKIYELKQISGGYYCKFDIDDVESAELFVGDIIDGLKVIEIDKYAVYVVLEVMADEEEPEEDEENLPGVSELRYKLDSGDILLFSDDSGINGAVAYIFGETLDPTFLFWAGGRLPTVSSTPTPDEKVSLGVGEAYTSKTIWDLTITVESVEMDRAIVVFETDDSISLMKTAAGGEDVSDIVERLWAEYQAQFPDIPQPAGVDMTPFYLLIPLLFFITIYFVGKDWFTGWGRT